MPHGLFTLAAHFAGFSKSRAMTCLICLTLLAGCAAGARAPIMDLSAQPAPVVRPAPNQAAAQPAKEVAKPAPDGVYVVKPGDTLYGIARATGVSIDALVSWNKVDNPAQLRAGQVLKLGDPSAVMDVKPAPVVSKPAQASVPPRPPDLATPPAQTAPPSGSKPKSPPAPPVADAKAIQWVWPASGNVIQAFSATTKGIDIAGAPGDPVHAAADGKVMYSGNGVRGLGNLLIINHQDGFITAYAHNRTLLAKAGQEVKRGAKIAELGQTDTTSPRLHFELRRQGTPVNPLQYLPKR